MLADIDKPVAGKGDVLRRSRVLRPQSCADAEGNPVIVGGEGGRKWVGKAGRMVQAPMLSPFVSQKLTTLAVKHNGADLVAIKDLIEAGDVTPLVGKAYQLSEVPAAIRDLEQRRTRESRS